MVGGGDECAGFSGSHGSTDAAAVRQQHQHGGRRGGALLSELYCDHTIRELEHGTRGAEVHRAWPAKHLYSGIRSRHIPGKQ
jgi:hypothetical protein